MELHEINKYDFAVNHPRNRGNIRTKKVAGTIWEQYIKKDAKKLQ